MGGWVGRTEKVNIFPLLAYFFVQSFNQAHPCLEFFCPLFVMHSQRICPKTHQMSVKPISRGRKYKTASHDHWQSNTPETGRQCWGKLNPSEVQEVWNCTVAHTTVLSSLS